MSTTTIVPELQEYLDQRERVKVAIQSFLGESDHDYLRGVGLTGNHVYIGTRNQYWFQVAFRYADLDLTDSVVWSHVFLDLAEFDRMTGSQDPLAAFGYRQADDLDAILEGNFE